MVKVLCSKVSLTHTHTHTRQMIRAVFKTSTFCSLHLADLPWGAKHSPRSLLNEQHLSTHHRTLENHTVACWFGEFGGLVAAAISLISPWNATLVCDHLALTLYESMRNKLLPVIKKKKSSAFLPHIGLRTFENFSSAQ